VPFKVFLELLIKLGQDCGPEDIPSIYQQLQSYFTKVRRVGQDCI